MRNAEMYYEGLVQQEFINSAKVDAEDMRMLAEAIVVGLGGYEQYNGHWAEFAPIRIVRKVRTKMGVAFEAGDITLGKWETCEWDNTKRIVAFSFRNCVDTVIRPDYVQFV